MNLTVKSESEFPLPASLFLKAGNQPWSTWSLLAKDQPQYVDTIINKQKQYGSRLITFMMWNMVDPSFAVENPFIGNPTAAEIMRRVHAMQDPGFDMHEISARWPTILNKVQESMYLVPTIFCGDDRASTRNWAFVRWYIPAVIRTMYDRVVGYNLISEAGKSWNIAEINSVVDICHWAFDMEPKLARKPIFVHQQGADIGSKADGLMYEFPWHPATGGQHDPNEVLSVAKTVLSTFSGYVWFQEEDVDCESANARAKSRVLRDLAKTEPRIVALPGPC